MELSDYYYYHSLSDKRTLIMKEYLTNEFNLLQWLSVFTVTFLLLRRLFTVFKLWAQAKLIPGPPCHSYYGHYYRLFSGTTIFPCLLSKLHEEYGPVVKLWLGPIQLLVSIKDPELIEPMPSKSEDKLPLTGRFFLLSFGQTNLSISSINEIMLDPGTRSESKLMIDDCIFYHLPNPKVALIKWEKREIEVHHV